MATGKRPSQAAPELEARGPARPWRRRARATFVARACGGAGVCLLGLGPVAAPARAQEAPLLDRAEQLADSGKAAEARLALARWERDFAASAPLDQRARGWFLAGRLEEDASLAEFHYLRVVIEGSSSRYADDALLRLAQYKYAQGEYAKGIEYLDRLRRDYPTSEHAAAALLWIARSARSLGDPERACSAAEEGLRQVASGDSLLERSLREAGAECREGRAGYSVQVAALKDERAAQDLARRLLSDGYDAWLVRATARDPLYRVRVGRGLMQAEAQLLSERLIAAGYSAFLVSGRARPGGER